MKEIHLDERKTIGRRKVSVKSSKIVCVRGEMSLRSRKRKVDGVKWCQKSLEG
jgi:hypothetical protein